MISKAAIDKLMELYILCMELYLNDFYDILGLKLKFGLTGNVFEKLWVL